MVMKPIPGGVRRIITVFGEAEFKKIQDWLDKKKSKGEKPDSLYGLAKAAIREYISKHK